MKLPVPVTVYILLTRGMCQVDIARRGKKETACKLLCLTFQSICMRYIMVHGRAAALLQLAARDKLIQNVIGL